MIGRQVSVKTHSAFFPIATIGKDFWAIGAADIDEFVIPIINRSASIVCSIVTLIGIFVDKLIK